MMESTRPSINERAAPLAQSLVTDAAALRLGITRDASGSILIDAGIEHPGGLEAGRRIAEICLGGLGRVALCRTDDEVLPWTVSVATADPVLACLGSQYAGWRLQEGKFFALGSGPGRALAGKEDIFQDIGYQDHAADAVLVLEVDRPPPSGLIGRMAQDCGVAPSHLTIIMTPTTSLAGTVQIVARSLEVALHKAHTLKFPLARIHDGIGYAVLPPPAPDFIAAMGRTNDAILYGGVASLFVDGPEPEAQALAESLPSSASRDYGRPFAETFAAYKGNFYEIDPFLFSPGLVQVTALATGRTFRRGQRNTALLQRSFGLE
jgi:methenyltetrahydromethanopterin cyclohydrolase